VCTTSISATNNSSFCGASASAVTLTANPCYIRHRFKNLFQRIRKHLPLNNYHIDDSFFSDSLLHNAYT
jgi:hypothetical protein